MGWFVKTAPPLHQNKDSYACTQTGSSIWGKAGKILAKIPNTTCDFHSLFAEAGPGLVIQRHNEFIQFEKTRVYPAYLLACDATHVQTLDGIM